MPDSILRWRLLHSLGRPVPLVLVVSERLRQHDPSGSEQLAQVDGQAGELFVDRHPVTNGGQSCYHFDRLRSRICALNAATPRRHRTEHLRVENPNLTSIKRSRPQRSVNATEGCHQADGERRGLNMLPTSSVLSLTRSVLAFRSSFEAARR